MATLLFLENNWDGRREFFDASDEEKAKRRLCEWVEETRERDIYLSEVGPNGYERHLVDGEGLYTSKIKRRRLENGQDFKCTECGAVFEDRNGPDDFKAFEEVKISPIRTDVYAQCEECREYRVPVVTKISRKE